MLRVGLTGGIGAGKSTVARRLAELGAVVVDADLAAREVVEPGTPGLAAVVERFGAGVLTPEGRLDRPALGRVVFADAEARADLNAIVHPLVAARRAELAAAAPAGAVVVEDVPLLVETGLTPAFPLVVVVHADVAERERRLVTERGMTPADARARIAAQAGDDERRAAADVWLDNPRRDGGPDPLPALVEALWHERLVPYARHLRAGERAPRAAQAVLVAPDPAWPAEAARAVARVRHVARDRALSVEHTGSTAVPGLLAKDVLDLQVVTADLATAGEVADDLLAAGLVRSGGRWYDRTPGGTTVDKAFAANADPGRAVNCHVRPATSPVWRHVLLFRDRLRADAGDREAYAALKQRLAAAPHADVDAYAEGKSDFVDAVLERAAATLPPPQLP
ncbi:dephospho-CoA kinase [Kineococcus rubinsiae]|uniref:dephospho-CoA kinase n=1 Tax=Kineococcus rubinsiae TaxID=2609562 RepID=UPI00142F739A|nr:dephospho-CoA kinase [Kineococcus rubinsiae]NIZ89959.1 dephospho-CoA kinase [Kineococcus rubinsiae]